MAKLIHGQVRLLIFFCCILTPLGHAEPARDFLKEFRGQTVLVDFWASWCGPCRRSFPWMNQMVERTSWSVGVESLAAPGSPKENISLSEGALATSGNSHRYLERDGRRYSHILDARTGWPVVDAPGSVTVQASTCTEAGMFATLSSLKGVDAERFLADEGVTAWFQRTS